MKSGNIIKIVNKGDTVDKEDENLTQGGGESPLPL